MTDEIDDPSSKSFKSIEGFLEGGWEKRKYPIGVFATAIEDKNIGIYTWDRFGRFRKADQDKKEEILNLLADIYTYESDSIDSHENDRDPVDKASYQPDSPYRFFGWPIGSLPDFEALAEKHKGDAVIPPVNSQAKSGATKTLNTHLLIIGALCKKSGIDITIGKGGPKKIQMLMQEMGCKRDEDSILKVVKKVEDAIDHDQLKN